MFEHLQKRIADEVVASHAKDEVRAFVACVHVCVFVYVCVGVCMCVCV